MIHPDYQYDSRLVPHMTGLLRAGHCDVVLGNRIRSRRETLAGGMPIYKYLSNRALTIVENLWLGQNLGEWHSGMRGYRREVLETVPWERNSDDFVFDSQFLVQAVHFGFRVGDIPVAGPDVVEGASSISFRRGVRYGLESLSVVGHYHLFTGWASGAHRCSNRGRCAPRSAMPHGHHARWPLVLDSLLAQASREAPSGSCWWIASASSLRVAVPHPPPASCSLRRSVIRTFLITMRWNE